ncbi:TolC family protein [Undibacterium sp. Ji49W]|uniref:TolC family protein n=1 Tax=Undibacterium sp. Ji49W TaxID=3413040 RepID=UPI003BF5B16A
MTLLGSDYLYERTQSMASLRLKLAAFRFMGICRKALTLKPLIQSLICINVLLICFPVGATETLEQVWGIALQRDHVLAASQQKEQAALHQLSSAQANYLPRITLESGYTRTESEPAAKVNIPALPMLKGTTLPFAQDSAYFGGVSISAPLFTSGKISSGVAAAQAQSEATQAHSQLTRSDLKLAIAQSYIAVLRAGHAVNVSNAHIASVSKHVDDVQALFDKGYVARHDLLASQVAMANARQLGLQANNAYELACAALNRWLGRQYDSAVAIQDIGNIANEASATDLPALLQTATAQRKELQELARQSMAYKKQASSVAAGHLPQIGLTAGYSKLDNRYLAEDKGWYVGIVMKWDLFDGGLIRHQASQLSATAQAINEMEADTRERIALQVHQSWLSRQEASARMRLVGKAVEQADETLALARERYRSGLAPNSDVLDAEARRLQAYSNRDNAIYDHEFARLQLLHASGQL